MVTLRPWAAGDRWLLDMTNTPEMTTFLGGPESDEQLERRHRRYQQLDGPWPGGMFAVLDADTVVGSIGFWEHVDAGGTVWETGWGVLPEHQRRGYARSAVEEICLLARDAGLHDTIHAFPSIENQASNDLCERCGFTLVGPSPFEYPKGHWMTCNDWVRGL